ncbi:hypothetical protein KXD93_22605 [Mucilaginibacter sp. BJC16-A38]|uniref:UPF0758 domain-containing protein n=1 Tax=Mucilaginibacter phenanthrenivorans TaxID=1234842 RepID=UPI00215704FB|nr:UPF0758 domain-containing protein [Mucilaginibacter phenanthrenivorans]MCR8560463.1 hypothetical protein [Mucilaginibacter phenanthrenivorans]
MRDKILVTESFSHLEKFYFFDFMEADNGTFYISISRSDHKGDDTYQRSGVVIFQENFEFAMEALSSLFRTASQQIGQYAAVERVNGIKAWHPDSRPREKMMAGGRTAMTDAELLAMLIGSGTPNETAVGLAARILASIDHDLSRLAVITMEALCVFKGMGRAKSSTIIAAMELGLRIAALHNKRVWLSAINN